MNDPYKKMQNLVHERWIYQKFPKFKKILKKLSDFAKNLTHNWTDWYMGHFFLKKMYLYMGLLSNFAAAPWSLQVKGGHLPT